MEVIAVGPAIAAIIVCFLRSPARAFLDVYLPTLLLIPEHLRWFVPGLPDIGFQHAAVLPIVAFMPLISREPWRWSFTDLLVVSYVAVCGYSEYLAAGWWDTQNLLFDLICKLALPYVLAKRFLGTADACGRCARRFVALLCTVMVLSLWEFRMGTRLFFDDFWASFFPYAPPRPVQYRWGYGRIGGPYEHAILAGIIFGVAILLAVWLWRTRQWSKPSWGWITLGIVGSGSALTMSRGPWLGVLCGGCIALIGYVRSRRNALLMLGVAAILIVPLAIVAFDQYLAGGGLGMPGALQASAQYRANLIPIYWPIVMERPVFGWGTRYWPKDPAQPSVDNEFLLQALEHGVLSLVLFVGLILWVAGRLGVYASRQPTRSSSGALGFTLLGVLVSYAVALATVWLGAQTQTVLFIAFGWAEALRIGKPLATRRQISQTPEQPPPAKRRQFPRMLAR